MLKTRIDHAGSERLLYKTKNSWTGMYLLFDNTLQIFKNQASLEYLKYSSN